MPKLLPALAARAAVVATVASAAAFAAVLPATTSAAAPAAISTQSTAPISAQTLPLPAAFQQAAPVTAPVVRVALAAPAAPAALTLSAMKSAIGKVGSPYRWGAAGPSAFDCSGLVAWSFKQAGIALPRTSRAQSLVGTPVAKADLQPGDLVFFYTPVSHVAIYIGGGKVVHASSSRSPVKISNLSGMPFHNARRL